MHSLDTMDVSRVSNINEMKNHIASWLTGAKIMEGGTERDFSIEKDIDIQEPKIVGNMLSFWCKNMLSSCPLAPKEVTDSVFLIESESHSVNLLKMEVRNKIENVSSQ